MLKKIIIICHEPLTDRIKSNFYIEDFIQAGFVVEYWDVSQYIFPGMKLIDQIENEYLKKKINLLQIQSEFQSIDVENTIFVVEVLSIWRSRKLYKLLSDHKCYMVRIDVYGNTLMNVSLLQKIRNIQLKRIGKIISNRIEENLLRIYKSLYKIKDFDVVFSSSILYPFRCPINHPDYERYLMDPVAKEDGYIVFLDVYYPLHPDLLYMMKMKAISPAEYQNSLKLFFDELEKKYNKPIVIAAHPKSKYKGNEFGNRKIIKGETDSLVKTADLVLLHTSNSISYSLLYDKPLALITNKEYNKNSYLVSVQKKLSITLNIPIYNIDKINILSFHPNKMSKEERDKYIYSYLTSFETTGMSNHDILLAKFSDL